MYYIIALVILVLLELGYFRLAKHFGIGDKPNARSSHKYVTVRGGGIIFLLGVWLWAAFSGWQYPWFLAGLTLVAIVSFMDDVHAVPNSVRLVVQFLSVFLMFYQLGILNGNLWWVALPASVVCVGITNAFNFMDGINGITGGYSLAVLIPLLLVNGFENIVEGISFMDGSLLIVLMLSVLVFCFFNFRTKAKCFAGDVGAISIAFALIFAIGLLIVKTGDFSYIMFVALYGVDTVLTIVHRIQLREPLGEAHRKHAYQLMANELKIPHVWVSAIYMALQLLISLGLIYLPVNHYLYAFVVLVILSLGYLFFIKKYYHLHREYLQSLKDNQKQPEA